MIDANMIQKIAELGVEANRPDCLTNTPEPGHVYWLKGADGKYKRQ